MAKSLKQQDGEKKKRSRKRKSRTEISSDSDSDSSAEATPTKVKKDTKDSLETHSTVGNSSGSPSKNGSISKRDKKKAKQKDSDATSGSLIVDRNADRTTKANGTSPEINTSPEKPQTTKPLAEKKDFESIYMKMITAELADDIDSLREANDWKSNSLPLLIHALKGGQSIYPEENKARIVSAANRRGE